MLKRVTIFAGAMLALASLAMAQETVDLSRRPTEGETHSYRVTAQLEMMGMGVEFSADAKDRVTTVNEDGSYVVESMQSNMVIMADGQEIPGGMDATSTTTYSKSGEITAIESELVDGDSWRMTVISNFYGPEGPVAVDTKWSRTTKGDSAKGTVDVSHEYRLVGIETYKGRQAAKVAFESKELSGSEPASTNGFVWIDLANGAALRLEAEITNYVIPGGMGTASMNLTLDIVE